MGIEGRTNDLIYRQPMDDHHDWQAIYANLAHDIGDNLAWSWFGHARFIGNTDGLLIISQWNAFLAAECLKRYGAQLAEAAGAEHVRVYRTGGHRPAHLPGHSRQLKGFHAYHHKTQRAAA